MYERDEFLRDRIRPHQPGIPKMTSTPSSSSDRMTACAPVSCCSATCFGRAAGCFGSFAALCGSGLNVGECGLVGALTVV